MRDQAYTPRNRSVITIFDDNEGYRSAEMGRETGRQADRRAHAAYGTALKQTGRHTRTIDGQSYTQTHARTHPDPHTYIRTRKDAHGHRQTGTGILLLSPW